MIEFEVHSWNYKGRNFFKISLPIYDVFVSDIGMNERLIKINQVVNDLERKGFKCNVDFNIGKIVCVREVEI